MTSIKKLLSCASMSFFIILLAGLSNEVKASSVAKITIYDNGELKQAGVATLVGKETLIINGLLVEGGTQIQVTDLDTGAEFVGKLVNSSDSDDLVIVSVKGLIGEPMKLAHTGLEVGRKVYLQLGKNSFREGTVHSFLEETDNQTYPVVQHTLIVGEDEFGAPLLNNCKELIGVSHNKKSGFFKSKLIPSETFGKASRLSTVKTFLKANNIAFEESTEVCLSETEKLEELAKEKQFQQAEMEKVEQEKLKKQEELTKLQKEKEEKEKELKKLEKDKKIKEEALKKVQKEKQEQLEEVERIHKEKQAELEKAAQDREKQDKKLAELEKKRTAEKQEREEEKEKQLYIIVGTAIAFLLFVFLVLVLLAKRKRQLRDLKSESELVQKELKHATAIFSDLIFVGTDDSGNEHRLKIDGAVIARTPSGVILGRSAQNAKFVLNVPGVSRVHLQLSLKKGLLMIEDLGSANGTAVNGKELSKAQPIELRHSDKLRIGTVDGQVHFLDQE